MERPQGGGNTARSGMQYLPIEQDRAHSSGRVTTAITDTRAEMGKHLDGLHCRVTQGTGTRLLICGNGSFDQFFSCISYIF